MNEGSDIGIVRIHQLDYLPNKYDGPLQDKPYPSIVLYIVVDCAPPVVHDPTRHEGGDDGTDGQAEQAHNDLVALLLRGQPMVGLALPVLGTIAHAHIVFELKQQQLNNNSSIHKSKATQK